MITDFERAAKKKARRRRAFMISGRYGEQCLVSALSTALHATAFATFETLKVV